MNIVSNRKIFYSISGLLFLTSIFVLAVWGLRLGIDFTGGSIIEVEYAAARPDLTVIRSLLLEGPAGTVSVVPVGERGLFIRGGHMSEDAHQSVLTLLRGQGNSDTVLEKRFDTIGPTIGKELKNRSLSAIALVILFIVLYVAWAFRKVSRPVPSWKYGIVTIIALFHDVLLPAGLFSVLGYFWGIEADTLFVTALLTILGFSVHDTIVVFDRIRENLKNAKPKEPFAETVNRSVNETIVRSINTSFTVLLAMLAVFLFGGESVRFFSLTLIAGVLFGTYSSIFIASPLLVTWHEFTIRKEQ